MGFEDVSKLDYLVNKLIDNYSKVKEERDYYREKYFELKEKVTSLIEKIEKLEPFISKEISENETMKNTIIENTVHESEKIIPINNIEKQEF